MNKILTIISIMLLGLTTMFAQVSEVGYYNTSQLDVADSLRPWLDATNHIRTADIAYDMDQDGKNELLATDYSNGGRVHVFELADGGVLELVWSSPAFPENSSGSTPRWVRSGDLDGDGNAEIIFSRTIDGADGGVFVYEYKGSDNDYGTEPIIDFPANIFSSIGLGDFRTNREQGWVHDFDGDGKDELIMANRDNKVYILGINGNAPGFASWQVEGGHPDVHPENRFSGGSWWHSVPCDYDGDGTMEIVNHYWNFYGFWSIEPTGPDTYTYPEAGNPDQGVNGPVYFEYTNYLGEDAVSYMGITPLDVDGDGNQELSGTFWIGSSTHNYDIALVDVGGSEASGVEVWTSQDQFAILKDSLWLDLGLENGEYWGHWAADLNGNGKDEILMGGVPGSKVTSLEYTGSGSILDGDNYDVTLYDLFETLPSAFEHRDSAGVQWVDTQYVATQYFIAKMASGDFNGNGKPNVVMAYQTVPDSLENTVWTWDGSAWVEDEEAAYNTFNPNAINLRVFEYDEATGLKPLDLSFITPDNYKLEQNYPNPFNPTTTIRFSLPMDKEISLVVYDMLGKEVKTLIANQEINTGSYEVTWDATNNFGDKVVSGNYIATLKFGNFTKSIKMMLLK